VAGNPARCPASLFRIFVGQDPDMLSTTIDVPTGATATVVDLTAQCAAFVPPDADGLMNVFVPHATAGLAILETGSGSDEDLLHAVDGLLPAGDQWRHRHGSAGHGRDHVLPAFIAPSVSIPVIAGLMQLGAWQSICLIDTNVDNPQRLVRLSFLPG
jgi:secondary thiamine-phosphate synthase enzyme